MAHLLELPRPHYKPIGSKEHERPPAKKKPIILELLHQMLGLVIDDGNKGLRDVTILLLGFSGAFRRDELVALTIEDIQWYKEGIEVIIPRSKIDQKGEGVSSAIPFAQGVFCAGKTLNKWLNTADIEESMIFRRVAKSGRILDKCLQPNQINLIVKDVVKSLILDPKSLEPVV